jgi:hypothetical protein
MTEIRQAARQLHEIAWSTVRAPAADPWDGARGTRQERRAGALQLLAVYNRLIKVLERRTDLMIKEALDAGSDYGEIAKACGVSRQAIRQRWLRRAAGSERWFEVRLPSPRPRSQIDRRVPGRELPQLDLVRLTGGPYDGGRDLVFPGQVLVYGINGPPTGSSGAVPLLACYVPAEDDAGVYLFAGVERDLRRSADLFTAGASRPRRVYELAAELGVESRTIMAKLQETGEFVRSASSSLEPAVAQKIIDHFRRQPPGPSAKHGTRAK